MKHISILVLSLALLCALPAWAQETVTIHGRIVRATTGQGFAGVRLSSPHLKVSAMTDESGAYSIQLPSADVPLVVEAPGCERQTVSLQGRTEVNITLLDAAGTGFFDTDLVADLSLLAQDGQQSALFTTQQSGQPGSAATHFIRGLQSLHLASAPLFVVDGVIWQMQPEAETTLTGSTVSPLALLDPADIERVEVLRDGSAIWGSKAAAGVVLITTKRARDMATRIEANISMGFQTPLKSLPVMDAQAYRRYATDVMSGLSEAERQRLQFTQDDATKSYYWDTHQQTDWLDEVNRTGFMQRYGINVSGGDDIALYRFSLGYGQNQGNIDGTSFGRLNVRFNSDINLTERLKLSADIAYAQTTTHTTMADAALNPYQLALQKSPLYGPRQHNLSGQVTNRLSDVDELNVSNPVALTGDDLPVADKYRFNINLRPSYAFTDALRLSAILGFSWDKVNEDAFLPDLGVADRPLYNAQGEIYNTALNQVSNLMGRQSTLSAEGRLDWALLHDWQHELQLAAGGRFYNDFYKWNSGLGYNTGSDFMRALSNTNSYLRWLDGSNRRDREAAWFLTGSYSFTHKYFLDLGLQMATSSRYGSEAGGLKLAGVRWSLNPSVQAAWLISSERWMQALRGINTARLRIALSQTGNDQLPLMANRTYLRSASFVQDAPGLYLANLGNQQLKWETTRRAAVGLDLAMLNHRWQVSADVFWARTTDLITRKQLRDVAGMQFYWDNDGELTNRGFEVSTSARLIDGRDWKLCVGARVAHFVNKVRALGNGAFTTDFGGATLLTAEGHAAGVFYGWQTDGVFSTAAEAAQANLRIRQASGSEVAFGAGDMHFVDQDANGIIDDGDRVVLGDPNPDIFGDCSIGLRWKHLTLDALFTYSLGAEAYNAQRQQLEAASTLLNQSTAIENRWTADGQQTDIPRATLGDPMGNSRASDRWVEDASFLKLRRLQVAYEIPVHTTFLQGVSVWAAATNLFTLTRYLGADPEFSSTNAVLGQGVDCGLVPTARTFQLGVKINL